MSQTGSTGSGGSGTNPQNPEQSTLESVMLRHPKSTFIGAVVALVLSSGMFVSARDLATVESRQSSIEESVRALNANLTALVDDLDEARDEQRVADRLMVEINQRLKSVEREP